MAVRGTLGGHDLVVTLSFRYLKQLYTPSCDCMGTLASGAASTGALSHQQAHLWVVK